MPDNPQPGDPSPIVRHYVCSQTVKALWPDGSQPGRVLLPGEVLTITWRTEHAFRRNGPEWSDPNVVFELDDEGLARWKQAQEDVLTEARKARDDSREARKDNIMLWVPAGMYTAMQGIVDWLGEIDKRLDGVIE